MTSSSVSKEVMTTTGPKISSRTIFMSLVTSPKIVYLVRREPRYIWDNFQFNERTLTGSMKYPVLPWRSPPVSTLAPACFPDSI
jgi:hypothetical protein